MRKDGKWGDKTSGQYVRARSLLLALASRDSLFACLGAPLCAAAVLWFDLQVAFVK